MTEKDRACEYLKSMAEKVGGDVDIYPNLDKNDFTMYRHGDISVNRKSVCVSLEESRESFNDKVKYIMLPN